MPFINVIPSTRGVYPLTGFVEQDPAFAQSVPALLAFTEFYCQSGGSNLNAGSDTGNSAKYTATNGNWSTVTNQYIPTDGSIPLSSFVVGDFASVYIDGASILVYIARVTAIAPGANGAITLSTTSIAGTAPVTSATTRTIKVGGAWKGPNGAIGFPITFASGTSLQNATNLNGNQVRVNMKNDVTYSITAGITASGTEVVFQGYTSTVGDGGRATLDAGTTNATILSLTTGNKIIDLIVANNATGTSIHGIAMATGTSALRCVVHDVRGDGINSGGTNCLIVECEVYNFNKSNTVNLAGLNLTTGGGQAIRNYIHDGTAGTNCNGIRTTPGTGSNFICNNIVDSCLGAAVSIAGLNPNSTIDILISGNDFYNNGYGIKVEEVNANYYLHIENNNFIKNTSYAFEGGASFTKLYGVMFNNGYGTGTQSNGSSGDYNRTGNIIRDTDNQSKISYPSGQTPYNSPTTGDFSIVLAQAIGVGRGTFTETDGTNTGTVGYPDPGAAQSQSTTQAFNVPDVTQILSDGFIGHTYNWKYSLNQAATFTLQSGTLPTGLTLVQVDQNTVQVTGTPTVANQFLFTIRATIGASHGDASYQLTVNADPDEGTGGVGGS